MRIIYFYQYFTTPKGSYGTRVYEFTKEWVEQGHEVIVVTSVYAKSDINATKFIENQTIDGIELKIINVKIDNKQSFLKRIYTFLVYSFFSIYYAFTLKGDIVIASSGPITVGIPGLVANIFRRKKFVFEVRDLWPEGPIELGVLKNKIIQKMSYAFEKWCYKRSSLVVALSPGMQQNILDRFPETNVISVTNSANIDLFSSPKKEIALPELRDKKFAIYTGNIGMVNNSELLYRAALKLIQLNRSDIHIVLIGDGQLKEALKKKSETISNIHFLDLMPKNDLVNYVKNAFVSLIPLNNTPMLATSSPNKLFESMAASVPVIQSTFGWIKEMLEKTNSGFTVSATDEDELVKKLIYLADNEDVVLKMGGNAHEYAKANFDKDLLAQKMLNGIEEVYKRK
ncbi:glycosyltransferase family 4 protein [Aureibaculum algae]|uniref:Glycosyltransferase family 4 protein n=1 Tax=Aureibaculum algae TaxID=2584122 RepID=A0A5B7TPF3_9FLAO|nr:glycosyltransferase family 4 protein [Aureibaculum algae]QCX38829.1 glycosyltransferase family 4 protein [Aureibaculum algae]